MKFLGSAEIEARKNRVKVKFLRRNWNYFVNRVRTEICNKIIFVSVKHNSFY